MKPTDNASPAVKRARICHFNGDDRLALALAHITNHATVDSSSDNTGIVEPIPGLRIQLPKPGLTPNITTERAVTTNCPAKIA
jgi:hypothetical protein